METSESKLFASFATLGFAGFVCAPVVLPHLEEAAGPAVRRSVEGLAGGYILLSIFVTMVVSAVDAFSLGYKKWGIAAILAWPSAFAFIWLSASGNFRNRRDAQRT